MARRDGCWNGVSFGSHIQNVTKNCLKQTTRQAVNFERKTKKSRNICSKTSESRELKSL